MSTPDKKTPPPVQLTFESEEPEVDKIFNRPGKLIQEGQCQERPHHPEELKDDDLKKHPSA